MIFPLVVFQSIFLLVQVKNIHSEITAQFVFSKTPVLVLIDGFSEYLSGWCKKYCDQHYIRIVDALSPYMFAVLLNQGKDIPLQLKVPLKDDDIVDWSISKGLITTNTENTKFGVDCTKIGILAESDSGVSMAEKLSTTINCRGNGISPHLRNKFLSNVKAREAGLSTVKQKLVSDISEALLFAKELCNSEPKLGTICVVKPYRGVASDGVFICNSENEIIRAFESIINQPRFGGGVNEAVLIQEFADGPEYAVDTVTLDGKTKIVALWKYHKIAVNDAPVVYQYTELVDVKTQEQKEICDYCLSALKAQGLKWGPTHTEIKYTSNGPRLIEINARWHAANFVDIVRSCIGYDAIYATLDAFFNPERFMALPGIPTEFVGAGRILHLVSFVEGTIVRINYLDTIRALPSTVRLYVDYEVGEDVVKTVDIRTDAGYVLLFHQDPDVVRRDADVIIGLQKSMFEVM